MFKGWWVVGTHFVVQLFVTGFFVYSLPLLFPPVIAEFATDATTVNMLPSIASGLGLFIAPIAGPLVDRWSAKGLMLIGSGCLLAGLLGMSVAQSIGQFVAMGALLFGAANTLLGPMTGSAVISRWFTASRGRALGIAAIGTSIGGMLVPMGLGRAIASVGWRGGLQGIALMVALIALPLLAFRFWNHPADAGAKPEPSGRTGLFGSGPGDGLASNRDILTRPAFWLFALSLGLFLATYTAAVTNLGQFYADLALPAEDAPSVMFVIASFGILGKLSFGYMADRMPLKVGLVAAIAATACSFCLFATEPGYVILLLGAAAMGLASGGILPVWNAMVPAIFGVQNFGRAMGWMSPVIGVLITPSFVIVGMVRDSTGSYVPAFQGFLGVLLVAALLLAPLRVGGADSTA